jgi:hypothetical protein
MNRRTLLQTALIMPLMSLVPKGKIYSFDELIDKANKEKACATISTIYCDNKLNHYIIFWKSKKIKNGYEFAGKTYMRIKDSKFYKEVK